MTRLPRLSLALAALLACAPPPVADPIEEIDPVCTGPAAKQLPPAPITNGVATPTLVALDDGQQLAVGALLQSFGGAFANICTATLVAPDVVLTAAHCVWGRRGTTVDPSRLRFGIGPDMAAPRRTFELASIHVPAEYATQQTDARYDIAVLRLKLRATDLEPALEPIPVNREPIDMSLRGTRAQVVGYGMTSPTDSGNTRRYWTTEEIVQVSEIDITVYGHGQSGVCFGDSGGPLLRAGADGVVRVFGTLSAGDDSCMGYDNFTRVDVHGDWLDGVTRAADPDCAGGRREGVCVGNVATYCEFGSATRVDCAATQQRCEIGADGRAGCVEDPCAGITFAGVCIGDYAYWCEGAVVHRFDCGRCGWTCGDTGSSLGKYCVSR
jgi:secreted trypsin-like serine protease